MLSHQTRGKTFPTKKMFLAIFLLIYLKSHPKENAHPKLLSHTVICRLFGVRGTDTHYLPSSWQCPRHVVARAAGYHLARDVPRLCPRMPRHVAARTTGYHLPRGVPRWCPRILPWDLPWHPTARAAGLSIVNPTARPAT